ncbi:MAG: phage terminase small subunit P27 family [Pseudomonadota bacterium]
MRGRKPRPSALKRGAAPGEPVPPTALPRCPDHLSDVARKEWRRIASPLHEMGVLTVVDRAALAAYCQAYGRWVEAERRLAETPLMLKTPSGYVQQLPWLAVANKQLELMGRYMGELGITPASRTRVATQNSRPDSGPNSGPDSGPVIVRIVGCDSADEDAHDARTITLDGDDARL